MTLRDHAVCAPVFAGDEFVKICLRAFRVPGLALAVAQNSGMLAVQGYGYAEMEHRARVRPDTIFELASLTKQLTATAIMALVEDGTLTLNACLGAVLPGLPASWRPITVRQLLTHTAGLPDESALPALATLGQQPPTPDALLAAMAPIPMAATPGTMFAYNNVGYFLLGLLIEAISGMSYDAFLRTRFFTPLGMTATRLNDRQCLMPRRARGYRMQDDGVCHVHPVSPHIAYAAGGVVSTVNDLTRWMAALHAGQVVRPETLQQMWTPATLADGTMIPYGLGWHLEQIRGRKIVHHAGSIAGFATGILHLPEEHLTLIGLSNLERFDMAGLLRCLAAPLTPSLVLDDDRPDDPHPACTARLYALLQAARHGGVDAHPLMPQHFAPAAWAALRARVTALGRIQAVHYLSQTECADGCERCYHVTCARLSVRVRVHWDDQEQLQSVDWYLR